MIEQVKDEEIERMECKNTCEWRAMALPLSRLNLFRPRTLRARITNGEKTPCLELPIMVHGLKGLATRMHGLIGLIRRALSSPAKKVVEGRAVDMAMAMKNMDSVSKLKKKKWIALLLWGYV